MSKILEGFAVVLVIAAIIAGGVVGVELSPEGDFNLVAAVSAWVGGLVLPLLMFAFGEHLQIQYSLRDELKEINLKLSDFNLNDRENSSTNSNPQNNKLYGSPEINEPKKSEPTPATPHLTAPSGETEESVSSEEGGKVCSKCKKMNPPNQQLCKNCWAAL